MHQRGQEPALVPQAYAAYLFHSVQKKTAPKQHLIHAIFKLLVTVCIAQPQACIVPACHAGPACKFAINADRNREALEDCRICLFLRLRMPADRPSWSMRPEVSSSCGSPCECAFLQKVLAELGQACSTAKRVQQSDQYAASGAALHHPTSGYVIIRC